MLASPVVRVDSIYVRPPFEVMTQLVGERFPGLLAPVEVPEPGEARERAVVEDDPRVQIGAAAAPLERHAFAESVDITVDGMRKGFGAHIDGDNSVAELGWHLASEAIDQ